ncbi:TldD/PmbA family protein [Albidovulum sp.]|uniref:TldD/PmbA family protein n=1 Tax=Albidovulum sp. TaxID=1872424 RepID=UPI002B85A689|nr:TldD/PmbA family protein [Defluviimonas sp.]MCO5126196.1 TldD/PmbA family protein [Paracoccaceae bacterium]HPE26724.1 TldD/PmbA family protein [Albidovulum sp.]MCP5356445.1 TldD/PmbA family protein [Paracoccaceae bacterium]MCP5375535.1 TldD/PmbA family protein [Paracoccaceae bacterium]
MTTQSLESLSGQLLEAARKAGADAADAMALDGAAVSIDVRKGKLEQAERSEGIEIGLRVLIGQRQAIVSASDVSARTIADMAERAVAMAREAPADPTLGLAEPADLARDWDLAALELCDPAAEPSPATLESDARRAEAAALSVAGVTQIDSASASYSSRRVHLAATNGFSGGYARTSRAISAVAISGSGLAMERDWAAESRTFQGDLPDPESIGRLAGERAVARSGARKPRTGAYPVIYDERVASALVGHVLAAVNGSAIARGASWLRDALGSEILPRGLSIVEDPSRPRISASRPFDGEGLAPRRRAIVDDGVLTGWTLDLGTARKLGLTSTASAVRGPGSAPSPGVSNIALTQGAQSREDLMAAMGTGLLVTSMIGSSINPTTGDYSRGASGFWVEGGQIAYPVNECTLAGNLRDMMRRITPANDARTHLSYVVPSLLVEGLMLAGE